MSTRLIRSRAARMAGYARVLEARSLATRPARLEELAGDEVRPVRVWTAGNPGTPVAALERLAADEDDCVRWWALLNPALSARALRQIADEEESEYGTRYFFSRGLVVHHPNAPADLRQALLDLGACAGTCAGHYAYRGTRPIWAWGYSP